MTQDQPPTTPAPPDKNGGGSMGVFGGVFTPSILTILGIILFLRLGFVVGSAGLARALIIIGLANLISILTTFSLAAIATNLRVRGGGDYYLISRTLGVEFGGAIGLVLFAAQSVSVGFYCIGFGEVVAALSVSAQPWLPRIVAWSAIGCLFILAWLGADWATKFQYLVMAVLAAALVSFFIGGLADFDSSRLAANWSAPATGPGFWLLFAIFFPAVTGFTQGVSMSGELKDPGRSLPLGTFAAVGLSIIVYFAVAVVFAAGLPGQALSGDLRSMNRLAAFGPLIDAGVIAATLSSAMASFLGAPRILQSMARDKIFPWLNPFGQGSGPADNPRRGVLLTLGLALATVAVGQLNLIAPVVSMFFLISYGLLNYATYFEARAASPSFRPRFRLYHRWLSLAGFIAAGAVMAAIDFAAGLAASAVLFGIHQYLRRKAGPARWADSRRSYHLQRARENLLAAASETGHPRDWRPWILALSDDPERRERLLEFAAWLEGGSGLTTVVRLIEAEGAAGLRDRAGAAEELSRELTGLKTRAFPLVVAAPDLGEAIQVLVQAHGLGPIRANTILVNRPAGDDPSAFGLRRLRYGSNLQAAFRLGMNLIIFDSRKDNPPTPTGTDGKPRRIDLWWWDDATGRLMLLLGHLITRHRDWEGSRIRVLAVGRTEDEMDDLKTHLDSFRIDCQPVAVRADEGRTLAAHCQGADLVLAPFRIRGGRLLDRFGGPLAETAEALPLAGYVMAAEDLDLDAAPEEGEPGRVAAAADELEEARNQARLAGEEAAEATRLAEELFDDLRETAVSGLDETLAGRTGAALAARREAARAWRRAARNMVRLRDAAEAARDLGLEAPEAEDVPPDKPDGDDER